jgi:hypothetical protein
MGSEGLGRQDNPLGQLLQGLGGGSGSGGLGGLAEMAKGMFGQASSSVQSGNPLAIGVLPRSPGRCSAAGAARPGGDWRRSARPARQARHGGAEELEPTTDAD